MNELLKEILSKGVITADDIKQLSTMELLVVIIRRVNECHDLTIEQIERVNQLLNGGLKDEVVATLDKWKADGTLTQIIDEEIIGNINAKLIDPELFRTNNQTDDEVLQLAIAYCGQQKQELHLYHDYNVTSVLINQPIIINGHGHTIKSTVVVDYLIKIEQGNKVIINNLKVQGNNVVKRGIFVNGGEVQLSYSEVYNCTECNIAVKKVESSGTINTYEVFLSNAPIGILIGSTDNVIRRVTSFDCVDHIVVAGGGCFIDDFHGWNWNKVSGSSLINIKLGGGGTLHLSNIYADTVETAIKLTDTNQYTMISGNTVSYFLNRSKYPDGSSLSSPKLIRGLGSFSGKMVLNGVVVDTSAWKDSNGNMSEIFDATVPHSRVQVFGLCNNGMIDGSHIQRVSGDISDSYIISEEREYYSPFTRKYVMHKDEMHIRVEASLLKSIPTGTRAYKIELAEPFNKLGKNVEAVAYVQGNNGAFCMGVSTSGGIISVYNTTGQTITDGSLQLNVHVVAY